MEALITQYVLHVHTSYVGYIKITCYARQEFILSNVINTGTGSLFISYNVKLLRKQLFIAVKAVNNQRNECASKFPFKYFFQEL